MNLRSEAQFQSWFTKWLASEAAADFRSRYEGIVYELKVVRMRRLRSGYHGWSLPPSAFKEHQLPELLRAVGMGGEGSGFLSHKISDSALGYKPCDGFALWGPSERLEDPLASSVASYVGVGEVLGTSAWFIPSWVVRDRYRSNKRVTREWCEEVDGKQGVFRVEM